MTITRHRQCTYKRNIEAFSPNRCCYGKVITFYIRVCVCRLSYPAYKAHAPYYIICDLQKTMQELNFPELTIRDVKLKIKTVRVRFAADLAKVKKKSGAGLHEICVEIVFFNSNFHPATPANHYHYCLSVLIPC